MWVENKNSLEKDFVFDNFIEAFSFMTKVAFLAEKDNHHPTMLNTYNKVKITLSTHDAGNKVTQKDTLLAKKIDKIVQCKK